MGIHHMKVAMSIGIQQMVRQDKTLTPIKFSLNNIEEQKLSQWSKIIDHHFEQPMNIEWMKDTVNGKLYIVDAPEVVIYDNACNLHQYCLNRDPVFFANTLMVVDGLHWDNHTGNIMVNGIKNNNYLVCKHNFLYMNKSCAKGMK